MSRNNQNTKNAQLKAKEILKIIFKNLTLLNFMLHYIYFYMTIMQKKIYDREIRLNFTSIFIFTIQNCTNCYKQAME